MTLRKKTVLTLGVTLVGLFVSLYITSRIIVLGGFAEQERQDTRRNVERVLGALANEVSTLGVTTADWAEWDDTYDFINDANEAYVETNLLDETFGILRLNLVLYVHSSGRVVFGKAYDLNGEKQIPLPEGLQNHLTPKGLLLNHPDTDSSIAGLLPLPEGPMLIASHPILTSEREGPTRGMLIFGRHLNSTEIQRLADTTLLSLTAYRPGDPQMPPDFQAALASLSEESLSRSGHSPPNLLRVTPC